MAIWYMTTKGKKEVSNMEKTERKNKNAQVTFRVFQAIFLGIFALGISSMSGDVSSYMNIPISAFSISTTIFGLIGTVASGILANKSKDW